MAPRSVSFTLVVLTITLLITSLISPCVATPKKIAVPAPKPPVVKPKPTSKVIVTKPTSVAPVIAKPTQTAVPIVTKSTAVLSSFVATQSVATKSAPIVTKSTAAPVSSVVLQSSATQKSSTVLSSTALAQATSKASTNSTGTLPVTTSTAITARPTNATLPTNTTSVSPPQATGDPDLPTSPLDLSNDPNDGEYFSPKIASRNYIAYGYDEDSNRTVVRSAKWTSRQTERDIEEEYELHKRAPRPIPTVCGAPTNAAAVETYQLDCARFPNICENACFFIACKPGAAQAATGVANVLQFTLDRNNDGRESGECRGDNKCGATNTPRVATGWGLMSQRGRQCDEFPFNVVRPGGALAATRCVAQRENGQQGRDFQSFINAQGPYRTNGAVPPVNRNAIPNCDLVNVQPINIPAGSLCLGATPQQCTAASPGPHAAGAATDLDRQE